MNHLPLLVVAACALTPLAGDEHTLRGGGFELTGSVRIAPPPPAPPATPVPVHAARGEPPCPADCDGDGALSPADLVCFLRRYNGGDAAANCDRSTAPPLLTTADFACFVQRYAEGCSGQ